MKNNQKRAKTKQLKFVKKSWSFSNSASSGNSVYLYSSFCSGVMINCPRYIWNALYVVQWCFRDLLSVFNSKKMQTNGFWVQCWAVSLQLANVVYFSFIRNFIHLRYLIQFFCICYSISSHSQFIAKMKCSRISFQKTYILWMRIQNKNIFHCHYMFCH